MASRIPAWFWAAYLMATHSNGISALQLQRQLAFASHKMAWLLCANLRRSMLAPGRGPLAGLVEVDETEIACRSKNDPVTGSGRRSHQGKMLAVGAVEVEDSGRIRLSQVGDYSAASLHPFLAANLAPGATAKTDGWSGSPGAAGVSHDPHVVGEMAAHIVLPWIHRIFSLQPSAHPACGIPILPRHRRWAPARPLQNVDFTGSKGIRLRRNQAATKIWLTFPELVPAHSRKKSGSTIACLRGLRNQNNLSSFDLPTFWGARI
jgi:hypothetical protein